MSYLKTNGNSIHFLKILQQGLLLENTHKWDFMELFSATALIAYFKSK